MMTRICKALGNLVVRKQILLCDIILMHSVVVIHNAIYWLYVYSIRCHWPMELQFSSRWNYNHRLAIYNRWVSIVIGLISRNWTITKVFSVFWRSFFAIRQLVDCVLAYNNNHNGADWMHDLMFTGCFSLLAITRNICRWLSSIL